LLCIEDLAVAKEEDEKNLREKFLNEKIKIRRKGD
jgi:hypothetical protein